MAFLSYGGAPGSSPGAAGMIDLEIVDTLAYDRIPRFAGPDYLYTEHVLTVRAVYSPAATAYAVPDVGDNPAKSAAALGPLTDTAVRDWLSQPRRQLVYRVGKVEVLRSPRTTGGIVYTLDAANGPFPEVHSVVQVAGWKTFLVTFTVRTFVNEAWRRSMSPPVVLRSRWNRERDIDQDGLATLVTQGHAVFNTELLAALAVGPAGPDDYFAGLAHPVEDSFKRTSVQITVADDNTEAWWVLIDREMPLNMIAAGVTRIEAYHTNTLTRGTLEEAAQEGASALQQGGIGAAAGAAAGAKLGSFAGPWGTVAGGALGGLLGFAAGAAPGVLKTAGKIVPTMSNQIIANVWGGRPATRGDLEAVARKICEHRMLFVLPDNAKALVGFRNSIRHDVAGRFVQVAVQFNAGPVVRAASVLNGKVKIGFAYPFMPGGAASMNIPEVFTALDAANAGGILARGGTRGSYLGAILAQTFAGPGLKPPKPPAPRNALQLQDN